MEKQNWNGLRRKKPTYGRMRTVNEQINMLPPVGTEVVIYENVLLTDRQKRETGLTTQYMPSDSYLDAHDKPRTWVIANYTGGIESPLDPKNWVRLVNNQKKSVIFKSSIRTVLIATGHFKLVPIEKVVAKNQQEVP